MLSLLSVSFFPFCLLFLSLRNIKQEKLRLTVFLWLHQKTWPQEIKGYNCSWTIESCLPDSELARASRAGSPPPTSLWQVSRWIQSHYSSYFMVTMVFSLELCYSALKPRAGVVTRGCPVSSALPAFFSRVAETCLLVSPAIHLWLTWEQDTWSPTHKLPLPVFRFCKCDYPSLNKSFLRSGRLHCH